MEKLIIRNERENERTEVENLIREAFWNVNVPGCDEHYLAHVLRGHGDFVPALDLVAELDGRVVGNVMYTRAWLENEAGNERGILTFGPVAVLPEYQRRGVSRALLEESFVRARAMGCEAIVIFGNPDNYVSRGFKSCRRFNVCLKGGVFPSAMLVRPLTEDAFDGRRWFYRESAAYEIDPAEAERFDRKFPPKEKAFRPSQEEFYIHSHSSIDR